MPQGASDFVMPEGIKTIRTTFRIIDALREADGLVGVSELASTLDLPVSTVHSHLSTLYDCEYVVKRGTEYDLGYRFLENGGYQRNRTRLYQFSKPKIDQLAAEFGDTVSLCVVDHGLVTHLYIATGDEAIETDTFTGVRLHCHSSAAGKAILSELSKERIQEIIDRRGLPKEGPNTITSSDELFAELQQIEASGIAYDRQERLEGIRSVAAPLPRNDENCPHAAISVEAPISRMSGDRFENTIPERVQNIAETIRIKLQYA